MIDLKPGAHIHLMGICGTAMASLAGILKERGYKVTGSDQNVYPPMSTFLEEQGIEIKPGYVAENLIPHPDFVVVGNVISKHYEEAQALLQTDIPYASLPETLRDFVIEDRHSLVVAGTHGKTTTTSMLAWVCELEGLKPGFLIGGIPNNFKKSFQNPRGQYWVIEGDEYDTAFFAKVPKFVYYKPQTVILSSIEFDHADIYNDLRDVLKAFESLMKIIPEDKGLLIHNAEDENIPKVLEHYKGTKVSYGFTKGDWTTQDLRFERSGLHFDVLYQGKKEDSLFVPMFGQYNVTNALSVYALSRTLGFKLNLKEAFASFQGVKRRQELIGEPGGIQVIEDFAHHPTAVKATIESFQKREGKGRLFVIFEPRSNTSRRKFFQKEYTQALGLSDEVLISRPFQGTSKEDTADALDVDQLVSELPIPGMSFDQVEEAIEQVQAKAKSGDTVLIMSNGGFQGIYQKILKALS
jgi:UDP-N-acetylmuramate: L-alanyl-gamma-D-glutamyl-meso-diaminopimelate ligase